MKLREQLPSDYCDAIDGVLIWLRNWWLDASRRFFPVPQPPPVEPHAYSLFDYDEAFVSPCTLNPIWCGGVVGRWTPRIQFMGRMEVD